MKGFIDIDINLLKNADWNYKKTTDSIQKKIKKSLSEYGYIENIIVRDLNNGFYEVINGNHRLKALKELDTKTIHCYNLGIINDSTAKKIGYSLNEIKQDINPEKEFELLKNFIKDEDTWFIEASKINDILEVEDFLKSKPKKNKDIDIKKIDEFNPNDFKNDIGINPETISIVSNKKYCPHCNGII